MQLNSNKNLTVHKQINKLNRFLDEDVYENETHKNAQDENYIIDTNDFEESTKTEEKVKPQHHPQTYRSKSPMIKLKHKPSTNRSGYSQYKGKIPLNKNKRDKSQYRPKENKNRLFKPSVREQVKRNLSKSQQRNQNQLLKNKSNVLPSKINNSNNNMFMNSEDSNKYFSKNSNSHDEKEKQKEKLESDLSQAKKEFEQKMKMNQSKSKWKRQGSVDFNQKIISRRKNETKSTVKKSNNFAMRTMYQKVNSLFV